MKRVKVFLSLILAFAFFSIFANIFWFYSSGKFDIADFHPHFSIRTTGQFPEEYRTVLTQNFSYLGHGKQALSFQSEDGKFVIKFFYCKRPLIKKWYLQVENWLRFASPIWIYKKLSLKNKLQALFQRYETAFHSLKEETGILFVHFYQKDESLKIALKDRMGKKHEIVLDQIPFVIQKKAELFPNRLKRLVSQKDDEGIERLFVQLKQLFVSRVKKGFLDQRQVFKRNYGFIGEKAIQIDVGKMRFDSNEQTQDAELVKIFSRLQRWVKKRYPELRDCL